ncbi:hybrid sensor histidine kinase/response regulator transcription factor [Catenovulum maritimum]|uniref:histidine kinase n=1 Tax=Catenovulum maritimum TaxID=1513271 RepID=A0A0J8GXK4_9ALTE|nr:hybrid sensor histidine kinase/response regulator transcription factor [Catenovulum maritimum]KMT65478.1 hypothetical protein XM47_09000 [Catenovulum maritimum]
MLSKNKINTYFLVISAFITSLQAETSYKFEPLAPLQSEIEWTSIENIPNRTLHNFDIDTLGNIWLATSSGIVKYDGLKVTHYNPHQGLTSHNFKLIKATSEGKIYAVGFKDIFMLENNRWTKIAENLSLFPSAYTHILTDASEAPDKSIYFAAENFVVQMKNKLVTKSQPINKLIKNMTVDQLGYIWLIEGDEGDVSKYEMTNGLLSKVNTWPKLLADKNRNNLPFSASIKQMKNGDIWLISSNNHYPPMYLDHEQEVWKKIKLPNIRGANINHSVIETQDGYYLITAADHILYSKINNLSWQFQEQAKHQLKLSLQSNKLLEQADGSLWLLEPKSSLKRFNTRSAKNSIYPNLIYQCEDKKGNQYFLNQQRHLVKFSKYRNLWTQFTQADGLMDKPVSALCSSKDEIWLAGSNNKVAAVNRYDGISWQLIQIPKLGKSINYQSPFEASDGAIYFGNDDSFLEKPLAAYLAKFSPNNNSKQYELNLLAIDYPKVSTISELPNNDLLLSGHRLRKYTTSGHQNLPTPISLKSGWIDDTMVTKNGEIWSAAWGAGILRYSQNQWQHMSKANGLSSNNISNLLQLTNQDILALSDKGIEKYNGRDWQKLSFPLSTGDASKSVFKQAKDGAIWIGNFHQDWIYSHIVKYTSNHDTFSIRYSPNLDAPDTIAKIVEQTDEYHKSIYVEWTGVDKWSETPVNELQYSYKLNDEAWSSYTLNKANYFPRLQPGEYQLQVRSRDSHGNLDTSPAKLNFVIKIPFWETNWFIALLILVPIIIAGLLISLLIQRIKHVAKLDRARLRFLTNISHELRTPLTLIIGPLEKISNSVNRNNKVKQPIEMALRNARRLNELVDQLLDYRKLQTGAVILHPSTKDFNQFIKMVVADFANLAESREQSINLKCDNGSYLCKFDPDAMRKILDNLVLNALKYSANNTQVNISVNTQEPSSGIVVIIDDQGIGIAQDDLVQIFDPFYSGNNKLESNLSSFGVGLALVKELVDLQNASITAESPYFVDREEISGTRFILKLPHLTKLKVQEKEQNNQTDIIPATSKISDLNDQHEKLILLIDDNSELGDYYLSELEDDFKIILACSGEEGLKLAIEKIPDIIISDVMMPGGMDGISMCQKIKNHSATSHIPIILQTSLTSQSSEAMGLQAGAIDYINKPISTPLLKSKIKNHLEASKRVATYIEKQLIRSKYIPAELNEQAENNSLLTTEKLSSADAQFIQNFKDIVAEHYTDSQFNAEVLASKIGMSRSAFYRKFKALTNHSPAEYIKNYRLDCAVEMLLEQGCVINNIAEKIGYAELSPFYRAFKKRFLCTPAEYRTKLQQSN